MQSILTAIFPVFLLIFVGFLFQKLLPKEPATARLLRKIGIGSCNTWTKILNTFALYLALPALIIASLTSVSPDQQILSASAIWFNIALLIAFILILFLITKAFDISDSLRNTYLFGAFFGNVAYIGFPFVTSLISGSAATLSILVAIHVGVAFTVGIFLLEQTRSRHRHIGDVILTTVKNPLLLAVLIGFGLHYSGLTLPQTLDTAITMLGASASPVVLIAVGTFIATQWHWKTGLTHALAITGVKILALPFIFWIGAALWGLSGQDMTLSVLEAAMPVALTSFALSERYPMDQTIIANAIIISTLLCFITLIGWSSVVI